MPPAVTLLVMLWGIATPSYWKDESATLSAVGRSVPQLLRMLGRVDAVHGFYYLLMWPVVHFIGTREFDTRLPSAVAMAAAALGLAAIGRRLRSRRAGLYAGLVFAALPLVSLRGHDARPYALLTAAAVLASYLLLRAAERPSPSRLAAYGLSLAVLGYLQLFGLLILLAHACALIPAARLAAAGRAEGHADRAGEHTDHGGDRADHAGGRADRAGGRADRAGRRADRSTPKSRPLAAGLLLRWLVTVAAADAALVPLAWLAWQQRWATGWLRPPTLHDASLLIRSFAAGTTTSALILAGFVVLGAARSDWPDRILRPRRCRAAAPSAATDAVAAAAVAATAIPKRPLTAWAGPREWALTWLAVPWLVFPPAALLLASQVRPVYHAIYLEYCLPAVALLVGAGLAALGWPLRFAALGLVVILGLPTQLDMRQPWSGGYLASAAQFLAQHQKPGDAVYFPRTGGVPTWNIAYPHGFAGLREIQLGQSAAQAGRLVGSSVPLPVIERRLRGTRRLWLVEERSTWLNQPFSLGPGFRLTLAWHRGQMWVRLYVRPGRGY